MKYALAAALVLMMASSALGQEITLDGYDLALRFESTEMFQRGTADGFALGMAEGLEAGGIVCLPSEYRVGQISKVVQKFLADHPERLHEKEGALAKDALRHAFPCSTAHVTR